MPCTYVCRVRSGIESNLCGNYCIIEVDVFCLQQSFLTTTSTTSIVFQSTEKTLHINVNRKKLFSKTLLL